MTSDWPADPGADDERRRYYRLTDQGHEALAVEVDRIELLIARGKPWLRGAS